MLGCSAIVARMVGSKRVDLDDSFLEAKDAWGPGGDVVLLAEFSKDAKPSVDVSIDKRRPEQCLIH
jgi:hypothetical protein